jgi:hypothetical protein
MKRIPLHYAVQYGNGSCVMQLFAVTEEERWADLRLHVNFNIKVNSNAEDAAVIGCPTSGVAQRAMREAMPHSRGVSKATLRRLAAVKTR